MALNYALIGCGRISSNHIEAAKNNKLSIRAVCDVVPEAMERSVATHDLANTRLFDNYREMLDEEKLDLVAIATESGNHASVVMDCLDAGLHVIVEKPIALSLDDADAMIRLAKAKNLILCPCHQNRFNKSIVKIRKALDQGRFGKLLHGTAHIRWNRGEAYYKQAKWRGTWNQDGGALMNQCIHNIDLLRWMMGDDIDEVFAYTDRLMHPYIEAEDIGLALIKFTNGSYGLIEGTTNVFPSNLEETLYLFGSTGTIKAGGKSVNTIEEWHFEDGKDDSEKIKKQYRENPPNIYGFGHTPLYSDVIDSIINGRDPYISADAGRSALELVLGIYESSYSGQTIKFPVRSLKSSDYLGKMVWA